MVPSYWNKATRDLARSDPVLARVVAQARGAVLRQRGDAFTTLARSIVGQQISVKAAQSVWNRVVAAAPPFEPGVVAALEPQQLRACGLSERKASYVLDLARRFAGGALRPQGWPDLDDEVLIEELTQVKGVGRWTAEMFLIFHLQRPDVLPVADLGLQRAVSVHYNRGRAVSEKRLRKIATPWAPWRTVATWYLWRSLDPIPVEY